MKKNTKTKIIVLKLKWLITKMNPENLKIKGKPNILKV